MFLEACSFGRFDLIIVHLLEGLPEPNISSPPTNIPFWNVHRSKTIEASLNSLLHISLMTALCSSSSRRRRW